jgi:hypothetical protein
MNHSDRLPYNIADTENFDFHKACYYGWSYLDTYLKPHGYTKEDILEVVFTGGFGYVLCDLIGKDGKPFLSEVNETAASCLLLLWKSLLYDRLVINK